MSFVIDDYLLARFEDLEVGCEVIAEIDIHVVVCRIDQ